MCRNIRVLHNFQPPTTKEEIRAASLQYVRKVSGLHHASGDADVAVFERAIDEIAATTEKLLKDLSARGKIRTREEEKEKGRRRWLQRAAKMSGPGSGSAPAGG